MKQINLIGRGQRPYLVAELSGNHEQNIELAKKMILAAKESGADAVKLQTYTPDTITLPVKNDYFKLNNGGPWDGSYFYDLYKRGFTPWEWHAELYQYTQQLDITLFSTPFDETSVDFLEKTIHPPVYKIASFELVHIPLLKKVAQTKKPVILSTGMATENEIREAVDTLRSNGSPQVILLKCISNYPALPKDHNLNTIKTLLEKFDCLVGLSDHSLGNEIALGSIALGACFIEKHFTLDRNSSGIDNLFSITPQEFKSLRLAVDTLSQALGNPTICPSPQERGELRSRRSIFISNDIKQGEPLSPKNIKIVRPADGLHPRHWESALGKNATHDLSKGNPLQLSDFK
ncbi:MAG: pseudaminic acid synthase [Verrucomicrobia bacterium GWC2_42_7]|nr:MAG: pseudaminic acid synthase [Verrucomicrobia bacterium GWC2_42_7]